MFRRRKERREEEFEEDFEDDVRDEYDDIDDEHDADDDGDGDEGAAPAASGDDAGTGPFDAVAPDDGLPRVDLGGMQVPVLEGLELRVEVDEAGQVVAATLVDGDSLMQLGAFAAPKTSGIWAEVRQEIADSIRSGGGNVDEVDGPYGLELRTAVPTEVPGQFAPARFVGIDGPRWFLRALFSGPAGTDPDASAQLNSVLEAVVIVRGSDAMPIRDPLPLRLPEEAVAAAQAESGADEQRPGIDPFERGPEITEVR
jgi:uncharacterized protein DUF3710